MRSDEPHSGGGIQKVGRASSTSLLRSGSLRRGVFAIPGLRIETGGTRLAEMTTTPHRAPNIE